MKRKRTAMAEAGPLFPIISISRLRMETDGAGVTTLVAGAGCPLGCRYCINERILAQKEPEWVTPEALFSRTRIDDLYFQATGGGLCFGGGEALLHVDFIKALRSYCGAAWKLTAETSLHVEPQAVRAAAECFDAFIVDIKTLDPGIYLSYTGKKLGAVKENLKLLASLFPPENVRVRIPLIPGYNTPEDREKSAAFLNTLGYTDLDLFEYMIR